MSNSFKKKGSAFLVAPALVGSALPGGSVQAGGEYTSPEYLEAKKNYEEALSKIIKCRNKINELERKVWALQDNTEFDEEKIRDQAYLNDFLGKVTAAKESIRPILKNAKQLYKDAISFTKEFLKLRDAYSKKFPEEFMNQLYEANEDSCKRFDSLLFQYGKQGKNSEYDGIYSLEFESSISFLERYAKELNDWEYSTKKNLEVVLSGFPLTVTLCVEDEV